MKIEKISLYHIRMPLVAPFETSFGSIDTRDCIIVEINSEGLTGWGEVVADRDPGYAWETCGTAWHILPDFIIPDILEKDIEDAHHFQRCVAHIRGHQMAKAGVEMALWDLQGQAQGSPLGQLLGGIKERVEVGVSVGLQKSPEALLEIVENYLSKGYRRVKLKIKPGRDVSEVSAVRSQFPDLRLQVDANSAYSLKTAAVLLPLDDFDLLLIEQPLAEDDLWDHSRLQKQFQTPLCLDESITAPRHARQALEMGACRIVNIKPGRVGGISQGMAIHDICQDQNVPVWCGGMLETGVGRAANLALASLPNFRLPGDISATERYYQEDITNESFTLNTDSTIDVPNKPGLGVTINKKALARFTLEHITFPN
ncbi:MAG: o-succinylbenzoate synthase [Anaerolineales bacterium]|nr:o-succinylbenzoate synthase [Chloroflexota bacterium]MBL6982343.1 o-succinylbenzoate synthase [Anaerolineales bacterium]